MFQAKLFFRQLGREIKNAIKKFIKNCARSLRIWANRSRFVLAVTMFVLGANGVYLYNLSNEFYAEAYLPTREPIVIENKVAKPIEIVKTVEAAVVPEPIIEAPKVVKPLVHTPESNKALLEAKGKELFGASEVPALLTLVEKESHFKHTAQNPHSTAYGMFQFLNGTWKNYGQKTSDPEKQIEYGLKYIKDRYQSPSQALSFHLRNNFY